MKPQYTPHDLKHAIYEAEVLQGASVRSIASDYAIPPSTLRDRLNGRTDAVSAQLPRQKLSPDQERWLVDWILEEHSLWRAPSHAMVRDMANCIARANGDDVPVGKNWINGFKARNPIITTLIGRSLDKERVNGSDKSTLEGFFVLLKAIVSEHRIKPSNIWNMDEHGLRQGSRSNGKVLGPVTKSGSKRTYVKEPGTTDWVSILECASAEGRSIKPLVIFKGAGLHSTWFPVDNAPDWHYTVSENGWTSNDIGLQWLETKFLPESTPDDPSDWRLLICDGHGSHATIDFMWMAKTNRIFVIYLPPHTSHLLQPLDLSFFGPLKQNYRRELDRLSALSDAAPVKRDRFLTLYAESRGRVTADYITIGFRTAGIHPYNPRKVLDSSQLPCNKKAIVPPTTPSPPRKRKRSPIVRTPSKPQEIPRLLANMTDGQGSRAQRQVQKVLMKGWSQQSTELAAAEARIAKLEAQVEDLKPNKRTKVKVDLNVSFAELDDIKVAQERSQKALARGGLRRGRGATARSARGRGRGGRRGKSSGWLGRLSSFIFR